MTAERTKAFVESHLKVLLGLFFVVLALAYSILALSVENPIIYGDEAGYFSNARVLVSGEGSIDYNHSYYFGYSLLLAPAFHFYNSILRLKLRKKECWGKK
jgi:hypothetical protein